MTIVLAVLLLVFVVVIGVPSILGTRAARLQRQNEIASAYVAAMEEQFSVNPAFADFRMVLIRQGLYGGIINFNCCLATTNDEMELIRLLRSQSTPYEVGGSVSFRGTTNHHWIMIAPNNTSEDIVAKRAESSR